MQVNNFRKVTNQVNIGDGIQVNDFADDETIDADEAVTPEDDTRR